MKGTFKAGFKYISNIFVVKEDEIEIGLPTDVKHVAHIGFDGQAANTAPSWMKEFKTGPDFAAASISNPGSKPSSQARGLPEPSDCYKEGDVACSAPERPRSPTKKQKRKKTKGTKSKAKVVEDDSVML